MASALPVRESVISKVLQICRTLISPDCHLQTSAPRATGMSPSWTGCPLCWTLCAFTSTKWYEHQRWNFYKKKVCSATLDSWSIKDILYAMHGEFGLFLTLFAVFRDAEGPKRNEETVNNRKREHNVPLRLECLETMHTFFFLLWINNL